MNLPNISFEARRYAALQLAERAGVNTSDLRTWKFDVENEEFVISINAGGIIKIVFPIQKPQASAFHKFALFEWMRQPPARIKELVPHFVVPHTESNRSAPLFAQLEPCKVRCAVDLLACTLLVLCRVEETASCHRDEYGRFPATASIAWKGNFLERPIVDEYALAFQQVIQSLRPGWSPLPPRLHLKVSHDIDQIGIPFSPRTALGEGLRWRDVSCTFQNVLSLHQGFDPPSLRAIYEIAELSQQLGLDSAFYWMAASPSSFDSGYGLQDPRVQNAMRWLCNRGFELGTHPGFYTFQNFPLLQLEVERMKTNAGIQTIGGRQHYLRWSPETWNHWESCNLAYDSTLGFPCNIGFRAGTCFPYYPWDFKLNRPLRLLEIPLLVMDCTLLAKEYMALTKSQALDRVRSLARRCELLGGVFTLLYHNHIFKEYNFGKSFYLDLLEAVGQRSKYDWRRQIRTGG